MIEKVRTPGERENYYEEERYGLFTRIFTIGNRFQSIVYPEQKASIQDLIQSLQGQLLVDGKDITEIDLRSYRSHISVVPQNTVLFSGSIRDNITMGMERYTEEQLQTAIKIANLEEMITKLPQGLDTLVGEHGDKLSGGQRQRIAIARAVIRNSSVIFFDEATFALDTVSEKLIQDSIDQLAKNHTIFIVAHRLSTIRNADKIAVIKDGKCVEFGTWDELMEKKGEFYKFKSLQS